MDFYSPADNLRRLVGGMSAEQGEANDKMRTSLGISPQQQKTKERMMGPPKKGEPLLTPNWPAKKFGEVGEPPPDIENYADWKPMMNMPPEGLRGPPDLRDRLDDGQLWKPVMNMPPKPEDVAGKAKLRARGQKGGSAQAGLPAAIAAVDQGVKTEADPDVDDLKDMKQSIRDFANKKTKLDLSPLFGLADAWTGANQQRSYKRPMDEDEKEQVLNHMKEKVAVKEADMRYKKNYLLAMNEQNKSRERMKKEDMANRVYLQKLQNQGKVDAAATHARASVDPGKSSDKRKARYGKSLAFLAEKDFSNPKNPFDKSYKNRSDPIHDELNGYAEHLAASGEYPDADTAYADLVRARMNKPRGKDAAAE